MYNYFDFALGAVVVVYLIFVIFYLIYFFIGCETKKLPKAVNIKNEMNKVAAEATAKASENNKNKQHAGNECDAYDTA